MTDGMRVTTAASTHACAMARLEAPRARRILVVAAHPDDETVGFGASLIALVRAGAHVAVLHATDGAPRESSLRPTLCRMACEDAAAIRRAEVVAALRAGGVDPVEVPLDSLPV